MDRVSTANLYATTVFGINSAQSRLQIASQQASTGKLSDSLSGYGSSSSQITAMRTLQARIQSQLDSNKVTSNKLDLQETSLTQFSGAVTDARKAVANALGSGTGITLITDLQNALSKSVSALNTSYNGEQLFGGSQNATAPVTISKLTDLTTVAAIANLQTVFANGVLPQTARLDDNTVVTTGQLASTVATPLYSALQQIEAYNLGANGPLTGTLSAAQQSFLQGVLSSLTTAETGATAAVTQNGVLQKQLKDVNTTLGGQNDTLTNSLGDLTDVDIAKAATDLQLAQFALQASSRVFSTLQSSSLLTLLPNA
jgi:flagellar hook-associated protein 3 FlgL